MNYYLPPALSAALSAADTTATIIKRTAHLLELTAIALLISLYIVCNIVSDLVILLAPHLIKLSDKIMNFLGNFFQNIAVTLIIQLFIDEPANT